MARRILVVTYFYPPDASVGSHRWSSLTTHLRRLGEDVTVLTTSAFGALPDDRNRVIRTADIVASPFLRRLLRRPPLPANNAPRLADAPPPRLLIDGLVPDIFVLTWLPFVLAATRKLLRSREYDCIVTSGQPNSVHLLGLLLRHRRPAWIADFEDGWRFEPLRDDWPTRVQDRTDAFLETCVARSAERVIGVTEPIVADFAQRHGAHADLVPMGSDPDQGTPISGTRPPQLDPSRVNIVYTGGFNFITGRRDPSGFVAALRRLSEQYPQDARRLSVVLAGALSDEGRDILRGVGDEGLVRYVGAVPRDEAVALQRHSDALLLLASGTHVSTMTGKIYEYLAANRPIIALASENEASRLIRATNTGVVIAPDDVDGVVQVLRDAANGRLAATFRPRDLERHSYPEPAKAFIRSMELAIAQHSAGLSTR